jgi:hypothetical protein
LEMSIFQEAVAMGHLKPSAYSPPNSPSTSFLTLIRGHMPTFPLTPSDKGEQPFTKWSSVPSTPLPSRESMVQPISAPLHHLKCNLKLWRRPDQQLRADSESSVLSNRSSKPLRLRRITSKSIIAEAPIGRRGYDQVTSGNHASCKEVTSTLEDHGVQVVIPLLGRSCVQGQIFQGLAE